MARTELDPCVDRYMDALGALVQFSRDEGNAASANIESAVKTSQIGIVGGVSLALIVGAALAVMIIRSTGKVLRGIAEQLNGGSRQVAAAASQLSNGSQTLAEGASEQAASLEETAASMEQMSSATKRNAENAERAHEFGTGTRRAVEQCATEMGVLSKSMEAIKVSSDDIAKIIKTIEDVAFQTNILALNAAVEAARAGEAGMGFAVVADEVRNLAQRCAQASKETAAKIEGSISKTGGGVQMCATVAKGLEAVVQRAREVDELIAEVATASKEQSRGVGQVNIAVAQMDKITQSNAASAEETASAAEELNAQGALMEATVADLLGLVGGANRHADIAPGKNSFDRRKHFGVHKTIEASNDSLRRTVEAPGGVKLQSNRKPNVSEDAVLEGSFKDF
jgi:methyl-accepting chemotaxis protein